jgi:hypothetical protein
VKKTKRSDPASLDNIIGGLMAESRGDGELMGNFREALQKQISPPCEGSVIGEPVVVMEFAYQGDPRRGVTARCRRTDGREYEVAALEVLLPAQAKGWPYLAAYRRWMGLDPCLPSGEPARNRVLPIDSGPWLELGAPVELVILSVKQKAARCRVLGSGRTVTLRAARLWEIVPGEIALIKPGRQWKYAGNPYLSGVVESTRVDAPALGLVPLALQERGMWDPAEEYWGEPGDPVEDWVKPIVAWGPRQECEMEQVLPGQDPEASYDPIGESNDRKDSGDPGGAHEILMQLCQADLRCLDAHAHLGLMAFDHWPKKALRHYEVGFRIGEMSLGQGFDGVLPWGWIDNRPFFRCMHGYGLCLWRLGRFEEAAAVFDRMLWLNPSDNQGVRFLTRDVRAKVAWEDRRDK